MIECPVQVRARSSPSAVMLADSEGAISYAEADRIITAIGERLNRAGFSRGDRIGILARPGRHFVLTLLALWRRSLIACPMNVRRPAAWLASYTKDLNLAAVLVGSEWVEFELYRPTIRLDELVAEATHEKLPLRVAGASMQVASGDHALILSTSGSTGNPKAALLTYGNLYFNALGSNDNIRLDQDDRWLVSLPLYHVGGIGILMRCILAGASMVFGDNDHKGEITHLSLVPTQLYRLIRDGNSGIPRLKAVLLGGAPAPRALIDAAIERNLPIFRSYGLTEMASQVTTTPPGSATRVLHTSGRLLPYRELRIADDGEILVRGSTKFAGYVNGDEVVEAVDEDGWFHTRDRGFVDDLDMLHVEGRMDNLFISGGENVQPEEIERALLELPGVEEAIVVPVTDEEFGARPAAYVRTTQATVDEADVRQRLRALLPGYMIPVSVSEMPREMTRGLKPDRQALTALAAANLSRRDHAR